MAPWGLACVNSNTINTPLTPYVEKVVTARPTLVVNQLLFKLIFGNYFELHVFDSAISSMNP